MRACVRRMPNSNAAQIHADPVEGLYRTLRPIYPVGEAADLQDPVEVVRFGGHVFVRSWRGPWVLSEPDD